MNNEKQKEANQKWRETHREQIKSYRLRSRRRRVEQSRQYYESHKPQIKEKNKRYRETHLTELKKLEQAWGWKQKATWREWLKTLGYSICSRCGYDKTQAAIEFHHLNPSEKEENIAHLTRRKFTDARKDAILREICKCQVLCANCHREIHEELDNTIRVTSVV